ncbi:MAG: hypothetical protein DU429_03330 [Candidatus Tokpelaia sp.]|uniref:hypothetical protein n=1 Tax=Candidatus Tokpelaia sp. TaxID=2233777 RepID=UPI00123A26F0|nr:hypothetical protein [Candidatus Tokpelaia sp.]KAA6206385.1 MAG: hypothetical protein DU430_01190 [Candidatus Tokpelaia sp.]KAA6207147.1 MAG: hypothetical protein DU429_03330 [Candidatus Tokpelaia sp.]
MVRASLVLNLLPALSLPNGTIIGRFCISFPGNSEIKGRGDKAAHNFTAAKNGLMPCLVGFPHQQ